MSKEQDKIRVEQVYLDMSKISRNEYSGIPAMDSRANEPEFLPYYQKLQKILDSISSGFPLASELENMPPEAELDMLKTLFLPEHAVLAVHISASHFETAAQIAHKAQREEKETLEMLLAMSQRGCIFHKQENQQDYFRHVGQIPGIIEFQPWRLSKEYREATGPYVSGYLRPVMFDLNSPSWRWIPINEQAVADNQILPYDNAEKIILEADKVSVCSCMCRAVQETPCKHTEPPYELCIQLNEFADFYVNDIKISRYIDKEEILALLKYNAEHHLAMEVAGSQKAEIICSCCECCCEPLKIFRKFGGQSIKKITNYYLDYKREKCTNCGECVKYCFTQAGLIWQEGQIVYDQAKCVGCGVCIRSCPENALILRLKQPEEIFQPPQDMYELYEVQASGRGKNPSEY